MGRRYGYDFEHEITYDKLCLVNDAVYIATKGQYTWTAVGSQFQHPYVFKTLFSSEELTFDDYCESKNVIQGTMYLDREEHEKDETLDHHRMRHLGRTGRFVPVLEGGRNALPSKGRQVLPRNGHERSQWIEAEIAQSMPDLKIDMSYFEKLKDEAVKTIEQFGSFEEFVDARTMITPL